MLPVPVLLPAVALAPASLAWMEALQRAATTALLSASLAWTRTLAKSTSLSRSSSQLCAHVTLAGLCHSYMRYARPFLVDRLRTSIAELGDKLRSSTAARKIVFGHHPCYTKGRLHAEDGWCLGKDTYTVCCLSYYHPRHISDVHAHTQRFSTSLLPSASTSLCRRPWESLLLLAVVSHHLPMRARVSRTLTARRPRDSGSRTCCPRVAPTHTLRASSGCLFLFARRTRPFVVNALSAVGLWTCRTRACDADAQSDGSAARRMRCHAAVLLLRGRRPEYPLGLGRHVTCDRLCGSCVRYTPQRHVAHDADVPF